MDQTLEKIRELSAFDIRYYLERLKFAVDMRIEAELGNGELEGIHDHASETIAICIEEKTYYFVSVYENGTNLIESEKLKELRPADHLIAIDLAWSSDKQLLAFQQLLTQPWIELPDNFEKVWEE